MYYIIFIFIFSEFDRAQRNRQLHGSQRRRSLGLRRRQRHDALLGLENGVQLPEGPGSRTARISRFRGRRFRDDLRSVRNPFDHL